MSSERDRLIEKHLGLVGYVGWRYFGRFPASMREDMDAAGRLGLVWGVDHYQEGKGRTFVSWLVYTIHYAMQQHLRDLDWVPRSIRRRQAKGEEVEMVQLLSLDYSTVCEHYQRFLIHQRRAEDRATSERDERERTARWLTQAYDDEDRKNWIRWKLGLEERR